MRILNLNTNFNILTNKNYRNKQKPAKAFNNSAINYRGIKVLEQDTFSDKTNEMYQEMSKKINRMIEVANSFEIQTNEEKIKEINDRHDQLLKEGIEEIEYLYDSLVEKPLKQIKIKALKKQIAQDRLEELNRVYDNGDLKRQMSVVDSMINLFNETQEDILKRDLEIATTQVSKKSLKNSKGAIAQKINAKDFSSIAGYNYEKKVLQHVFIKPVKKEQLGEETKVPGSILFFGPWNNGKTYITNNLAKQSNCRFAKLKTARRNSLLDKLNELAQEAQNHFNQTNQRTIIFIDELDRYINPKTDNQTKKEFENFLEKCSKDYHCTVFAATNNPSYLKLDFDNKNIFPIRMSIDIPEDENLKEVLKFYLEDLTQKDIDYDAIISELKTQEQLANGRYSNGQFKWLYDSLIEKYGKGNLSEKEIIEYIKEGNMPPALNDEDIAIFQDEYKKIIGE